LQTFHALTLCRLNDRVGHLRDVPRQFAISHRILCHEPEQVRLPKDPIQCAADFVAQPSTGGVEAISDQSGMRAQEAFRRGDVTSVDARHCIVEK
jgi:hypothetical protein